MDHPLEMDGFEMLHVNNELDTLYTKFISRQFHPKPLELQLVSELQIKLLLINTSVNSITYNEYVKGLIPTSITSTSSSVCSAVDSAAGALATPWRGVVCVPLD